jgi:hypothetical protein
MDYLRFERFSLQKTNLRAELIDYGCTDGEIIYKTSRGEEKVIKCWKKPDDEELLSMDAFYEDIYDSDADILQKNKARKEQAEGADESVKF